MTYGISGNRYKGAHLQITKVAKKEETTLFVAIDNTDASSTQGEVGHQSELFHDPRSERGSLLNVTKEGDK